VEIDKPMFVELGVDLSTIPEDFSEANSEKISSTRYKVSFSNPVLQKVPIVFNETFDEEWVLAEKCNWLRCKRLENYEHFLVNNFANGFVIENNDEQLESFLIVHESEYRFKVGEVISIVVFVVLISALGHLVYKSRPSTSKS
jgi:hypothetical protein